MKQLHCEMCGSSDLIKDGGVFVCQNCGTKYSVEEAKKMMVEGTVHVDSSHLSSNYLSMAKNALDAGNNSEADSYCNKIIEVDPTSYEAWFIKGKAVGWQSTLGNQRIAETINAFSNALDNCPDDEKEELANNCKQEIENLHKALLTVRMQNFMNHPNDNDLAELTNDVKNITVNTINFLVKAGISADTFGKGLGTVIMNAVIHNYSAKILREYQGDDGKPGDYEFKRFMSESDICVGALNLAVLLLGSDDTDDLELLEWRALAYDCMIKFNTLVRDACSWDYNYNDWGGKSYYKKLTLNSNAISARDTENRQWEAKAKEWRAMKTKKENAIKAEKERVEREEAQKRYDAYWSKHAAEKEQFETERKNLQDQIAALKSSLNDQVAALNEEINSIPGAGEISNYDMRVKQLTEQIASLGMFKGKEKKSLQAQIDQVNASRKVVQDRMESEKRTIENKINAIKAEMQSKISSLQSRVNYINTELTKKR